MLKGDIMALFLEGEGLLMLVLADNHAVDLLLESCVIGTIEGV